MSGVSLQKVIKYKISDQLQSESSATSTNSVSNMQTTDSIQADTTLTRYSSKYPELKENFTLLFNAVKTLKNNVTKEKFHSLPQVHKSVSNLIEAYSNTNKYELKKVQSDFLTDIGFVNISKDLLTKLVDLCPHLLLYDREETKSSNDDSKKMVSYFFKVKINKLSLRRLGIFCFQVSEVYVKQSFIRQLFECNHPYVFYLATSVKYGKNDQCA